MKITEKTTLDELLNYAVNEIANVESGEVFIVKELFRGYEWNRIGKGDRTRLGSRFLRFEECEGSELIEKLNKTLQNQQRYQKK